MTEVLNCLPSPRRLEDEAAVLERYGDIAQATTVRERAGILRGAIEQFMAALFRYTAKSKESETDGQTDGDGTGEALEAPLTRAEVQGMIAAAEVSHDAVVEAIAREVVAGALRELGQQGTLLEPLLCGNCDIVSKRLRDGAAGGGDR